MSTLLIRQEQTIAVDFEIFAEVAKDFFQTFQKFQFWKPDQSFDPGEKKLELRLSTSSTFSLHTLPKHPKKNVNKLCFRSVGVSLMN